MTSRQVLTVAMAVGLLCAGCSGAGDGTRSTSTGAAPASTDPVTPSTGPSATSQGSTTSTSTLPPSSSTTSTTPTSTAPVDPAVGAQRDVEALIGHYDSIVAQILADPSVASDLAHPLVLSYLELFSGDNQFPLDTLGFWAGQAGRFYRPGPRGTMYESTVVSFELRDDATAVAQVCTFASAEVVDASGDPIEAIGGVSGGEVFAVMTEGGWRLRDLSRTGAALCPDPADGE